MTRSIDLVPSPPPTAWILAILLLFATSTRAVHAQTVSIASEQTVIVIEGTSNVSSFSCRTRTIAGKGRVAADDESSAAAEAQIEVDVRSFECGDRRMNEDLIRALKADRHRSIAYRLDFVEISGQRPSGEFELDVVGTVSVAGIARNIRTRVVGDRLANGYLRAGVPSTCRCPPSTWSRRRRCSGSFTYATVSPFALTFTRPLMRPRPSKPVRHT